MYELELFAGAGGGILGGHLLGWRCVGAVEIDPYARAVLIARQQDGTLPPFPVWSDVRTFTKRNGACRRYFRFLRRIRRSLVIKGGFPCQDISVAGKGAGLDGERSGLWREFARVVREVRPAFVLVENSPALTFRGLGDVLRDLAALGYDARWCVLGAINTGAPHRRERLWLVAHAENVGRALRLTERSQPEVHQPAQHGQDHEQLWWATEPTIRRMVAGVADELDLHGVVAARFAGRLAARVPMRTKRLHCLGNGQVPACLRLAWETLTAL